MAKPLAFEGLWTAELMLDGKLVNIGVVVFQPRRTFGDFYVEGSILGGDRHYTYTGSYRVENHVVSASIRARRYDVHEDSPLFGADEEFTLSLTGKLDSDIERDVIGLRASRPGRDGAELRLTRRCSS